MVSHIIWAAGLAAHLLLLYVLCKRKHAAELPSFTLLILFYVARSVVLVVAQRIQGHPASVVTSLLLDGVDVLLQCAVLAELAGLALKPLRRRQRWTLPVLLVVSAVLMVNRLAPHGAWPLPRMLVLAHFLLSILMVEWALMVGCLLRPLGRCWRSPAAAISLGFGVYSAALLAGGGYFTTGRLMRDYVFFSYIRVAVYLAVVLFWAASLWVARRETA